MAVLQVMLFELLLMASDVTLHQLLPTHNIRFDDYIPLRMYAI